MRPIVLLFTAAAPAALLAQVPDFSRTDFTTREEPTCVVGADLDEDGLLDLVISNTITFQEYLTVFRGDSAGGFLPELDIPVPGRGVLSFARGDLDEDGSIDLLVPCQLSDQVFLYRGDGNGGFGEPEEIWAGIAPQPVTVSDLDRDGHLDFAASSWVTGYVNVAMGRGDGTFSGPTPYFVQGGPNYHGIGDFNEDGFSDIAVANSTYNDVALLLGRGDGTFVLGETFDVLFDAYTLDVGDFDEDGHEDIACGTHRSLSILLGDGEGGFERVQDFFTVPHFKWVSVCDFNEDRHDDVALCIKDLSMIVLFPGDGSGHFGSYVPFQVGTRPQSLFTTDLDADGHADFLTACGADAVVTLLANAMDEDVHLDVPQWVAATSGEYTVVNAPFLLENRRDSQVNCDLWLTVSGEASPEALVPVTILDWPANPLPLALDPFETLDLGLSLVGSSDFFGGRFVFRLRLGRYLESLYSIETFETAPFSVSRGD